MTEVQLRIVQVIFKIVVPGMFKSYELSCLNNRIYHSLMHVGALPTLRLIFAKDELLTYPNSS